MCAYTCTYHTQKTRTHARMYAPTHARARSKGCRNIHNTHSCARTSKYIVIVSLVEEELHLSKELHRDTKMLHDLANTRRHVHSSRNTFSLGVYTQASTTTSRCRRARPTPTSSSIFPRIRQRRRRRTRCTHRSRSSPLRLESVRLTVQCHTDITHWPEPKHGRKRSHRCQFSLSLSNSSKT